MPLKDYLSITVEEAQQFCKVPPGAEDFLFELWIQAAIKKAENFLCFTFDDANINTLFGPSSGSGSGEPSDLEDELALIKLGCFVCIGRWYEYRRDGVKSEGFHGEQVTWEAPEEAKSIWSSSKFKRLPGI